MAKSKKNTKKNQNVGAIMLIALLALLLAAIIVTATVLGVMSDGFRDWSFITGKPGEEERPQFDIILSDGEMIDLYNEDSAKIVVCNGGKFTVTVQPKADAFFDFKLDGKLCAFSATSGDYNRAFSVSIEGDVVSFSSTFGSMLDLLNDAYFGHVISDVPKFDTYGKVYFECVITAEDGQRRVVDIFGIGKNTRIDIDPGKVVF